jgi:hypothetical protein
VRRSDFRPLSGLTAEALAVRLRRGDAGADALLQQFAFEISDAGDDRRHHAAMRRRQSKPKPFIAMTDTRASTRIVTSQTLWRAIPNYFPQ